MLRHVLGADAEPSPRSSQDRVAVLLARPPPRLRRSATPPERRPSPQAGGALFDCAKWRTFRLRLTPRRGIYARRFDVSSTTSSSVRPRPSACSSLLRADGRSRVTAARTRTSRTSRSGTNLRVPGERGVRRATVISAPPIGRLQDGSSPTPRHHPSAGQRASGSQGFVSVPRRQWVSSPLPPRPPRRIRRSGETPAVRTASEPGLTRALAGERWSALALSGLPRSPACPARSPPP